jgi:hypothetical protein
MHLLKKDLTPKGFIAWVKGLKREDWIKTFDVEKYFNITEKLGALKVSMPAIMECISTDQEDYLKYPPQKVYNLLCRYAGWLFFHRMQGEEQSKLLRELRNRFEDECLSLYDMVDCDGLCSLIKEWYFEEDDYLEFEFKEDDASEPEEDNLELIKRMLTGFLYALASQKSKVIICDDYWFPRDSFKLYYEPRASLLDEAIRLCKIKQYYDTVNR